jgi:hypothetical protein
MTTISRGRLCAASLSAALLLGAIAAPAAAQGTGQAELAARLDKLAAELAAVKAELARLQQQQAVPNGAPAAPAAGVAPVAATAPPAPPTASGPGLSVEPATVLSSYGELNYNRPTRDSKNAVADLRRFVLGFQHRFDEKTKVVTELEVEHAVSSADDRGEVEIEQAYLERRLAGGLAVRAGLFLMPVGLLNENHEPTAFYGVERNFVETAIIPSTWREGGVQVVADLDNGLTLQGGITTGFDLSKWDATSTEGAESPLGAIHQELSVARARDLSLFGAVNWRGVPGLLLGGSIFSGGASHGQTAARSRVTLWDLHARYTPGRWDLSTVYSRGSISNTAAFNTPLVGATTLVPKTFDGWYGQAAYRLWSRGDYTFSPFARWEQFNTARSFADLGAGLTPATGRTERVVTVGANFAIGTGIVLKADYQRFRQVRDNDRFDLGVGWSF